MRHLLIILVTCLLLCSGCQKHVMTDYRPLDQAGMFSSNIEQLKAMNTSDAEVAQMVKLKGSGVSDETCVALLRAARAHQHVYNSADATIGLAQAGFSDQQILDIAQADQIDILSGDAITLKLIGLSDNMVQNILHRHLRGEPTLSSALIGQLKNTGLTERQIFERINAGMSDAQAEAEVKRREALRNHANTSFVREHGRRPR
jgi:hypothetical protein